MAADISKNNIIHLTRGDSFEYPLFLNKGTAIKPLRYHLKDADRIYLGIMEPNQPFECAIVKKAFTNRDVNINDDVLVKLEPEDTECLIPGPYFYTIKAMLIKSSKTAEEDISITDQTILKRQSKLTAGSTINHIPVIIPEGKQYYTITDNEVYLYPGDVIKKFSNMAYESIINGEQIDTGYAVNTVVPTTEFYLS